MNFLERHGKKIALALCFATCVPVISTVYAYEAQPGWHGEGADRYYVLESTREQAVGWLHLNDGTYYFDDNGAMVFGWQEIDSFRYYFGTDGRMVSGEQTIDDVSYNFQEDGKLLTGWTGDFLYDEHGFAVTEQYIEIKDGKYVYVDENGQRVNGWQTINGKKHYFDQKGIMLTGTIEVDGKRYELDEYGVLYTGWTYDADDNAYYHDQYGKLLKDTEKEIEGIMYVFDEDGIAKEKAVVEAEKTAEEEKKKQEEEEQRRKAAVAAAAEASSGAKYDVNGNGIAEAALAQVGTAQDCTMLVTNALAANGIYYHGWPSGYMSLGTVTDDPQPGDLIYYADGGMGMAHIAVYIGNGQAVHGGYNGNETVVASAYLGSGPVFIHLS